MTSTASPTATSELQLWINRAIESLLLLTVFLVPLAFFDRDYAKSETIIAYVEVPKVALQRTLVGSLAILWLIDWGMHGSLSLGNSIRPKALPAQWMAWLKNVMRGEPHRWLFLAVGFYLGTTLLSTILSGSFSVSLWGEIPGQDGYPAYTVATYVLLFAVIATQLKTRPQLWRMMGAIVAMGTLISAYAVLQHYGHDALNLTETTGGGPQRATSFMGNAIFAAATMMMTVPITAAATVVAIFNLPERNRPPERNRAAPNRLSRWLPTLAIITAGALVLDVQFLGLIFTLSRGPWVGTILALGLTAPLVAVFVGATGIRKLAAVLGLAGIVAIAILLNPSLSSGVSPGPSGATDAVTAAASSQGIPASQVGGSGTQLNAGDKTARTSPTISVGGEPSAAEAFRRLSSIKDVISGGLTGGRQTHWKVSWVLIKDRPWFAVDSLSLRWLRPLVGYGPDLFRYTYLLESPPEGSNFYLLEPDHAHNYFIHQTVEQGFLGVLSSLGIFFAVSLAGAFQLLRSHRTMSPLHKLILITLISLLAGRAVEMIVGVARVSDLTIFWAFLGMFAALPVVADSQEPASQPARSTPRQRRPNLARTPFFPRTEISNLRWLGKSAVAAGMIILILTLTWTKGISYPLAAVQPGKALEYPRQVILR